jgi:4-amino-4-deoxy-L-arabinose transferase-like glycosyltransferase
MLNKLTRFFKNNKEITLIFLLALALRTIGIQHGFPFIFHIDEPAVVRSALAIRFNPNPDHFDWPHLYFYMNFFLFSGFAFIRKVIESIGLQGAFSSVFPLMWNDHLIFYLLSRTLSAFLGALTVVPVFLTGRNLFGMKAGLLSALIFALLPFHVRHSHYALIDVPTTFFLSWALFFASNIFLRKKIDDYILAGLFIGFAASTKYNGGLAAVIVPLAHLARLIRTKEKHFSYDGIGFLILSGVSAFTGFALGTPYAILDYATFSRTDSAVGAYWQFTNVGKADLPQQISNFIRVMWEKIPANVGYTPLIIYWVGFFYALWSTFRKKLTELNLKLWFLYLPSLFLFFYISGFDKNRSHYYMVAYPFVAILAGLFLTELTERLKIRTILKAVLVTLVLLVPLYLSVWNIMDLKEMPEVIRRSKIYGGDLSSLPDE